VPAAPRPVDPLAVVGSCWQALGGPVAALGTLDLRGPVRVLPSVYETTALATATVAVATLAVAELQAARARRATPARVTVDARGVAAAFRCESLLAAEGWELPAVWDPLAGDYPTSDGWVRLHTNYAHHRAAALRALGGPPDRQAVAAAVAERDALEVEEAVVAAGGCAAALRTVDEWSAHPQGVAVGAEPLVDRTRSADGAVRPLPVDGGAPLAGVRVLDLTRVIAGPVATRFLAAHGADVLRVDPPAFDEVPLLVVETTAGKRCTFLDLRDQTDRATFEALLAGAHVLVSGYRNGALDDLGYREDDLAARHPGLVHVRLDAYGWTGPWAGRRGFDSLVQMSTGIAERGRRARGVDAPVPLPAQALDHGTGYLAAAAAARGLTDAILGSPVGGARLSLARTAHELIGLGDGGEIDAAGFGPSQAAAWMEPASTAWGPVRRARVPGEVEGWSPALTPDAGPLGAAPPRWSR
jgi:crotonobetainyl-CoA:carnitine CoA-transferase CaiB-like acyl-CoA transferase